MTDFLISDDFDIMINNGDFVVGNDAKQRIALIMRANQGDFKQYPLLGIGLQKKQNAPIPTLLQDLVTQLKADNISLPINELKTIINAQ